MDCIFTKNRASTWRRGCFFCLFLLSAVAWQDAFADSCADCRIEQQQECREKCADLAQIDSIICNKSCRKGGCLEECTRKTPFLNRETSLNPHNSKFCARCLAEKESECSEICSFLPIPGPGIMFCKGECLGQQCKKECEEADTSSSEFEIDEFSFDKNASPKSNQGSFEVNP